MTARARCGIAAATVAALMLTACTASDEDIPQPTQADFAEQVVVVSAHPGMNCYLHWVGYYTTDCYGYGVRPPYSVHIYPPRGCTCPTPLPRPSSYVAPRPVVANRPTGNTTISHSSPAPIPPSSSPRPQPPRTTPPAAPPRPATPTRPNH
ncbi:hypothetical protein [Streptacidiphilus jiangxiensis]|uniref:Lipoprotein n=1 Tax=Streptacidiphilus jiangxiensis TaxID=235985 RepID=A0A1H8B9Z8_STRJI|nr:hypothetical protein [Streptacidiphilus jiangxiensis]SEM79781.1 hypothetical protein SAMN05414137_1609 [Streptacidiphilus jiangxiensis]